MKKLQFILLLGLLLAACSKDKNEQLIFVTNVVMPAEETFNPGDKVTISAQGFQADDEIMFEIRWPLPNEVIQEGYALGVLGIIMEKSATSTTFLAPGHHPASTVKVFLRRAGQMMELGKIKVTDGQAPQDYQLYGIINSYSDTELAPAIHHIDLETHKITEVTQLPEGQDLSCVINAPGSWMLHGIKTQDGKSCISQYDLSMNYWKDLPVQPIVTMGANNGSIMVVYHSGNELYLNTSTSFSRSTSPSSPIYKLPDGLKAESLMRYPCIRTNNPSIFLLSADNEDGTFSPVVLDIRGIKVYERIQATALIPFWIVAPVVNAETIMHIRVGGYAVVTDNGTELRLWNQTTMTLDDPFTTFPNPACSITTLISDDLKTQKLYVLFDSNRSHRLIHIYDLVAKEWQQTNLFGLPYSEIMLAR